VAALQRAGRRAGNKQIGATVAPGQQITAIAYQDIVDAQSAAGTARNILNMSDGAVHAGRGPRLQVDNYGAAVRGIIQRSAGAAAVQIARDAGTVVEDERACLGAA